MIEAATCGRWTGEDEPRSECRIAKSDFDKNCVNVDNNRVNLMLMIIKLMLIIIVLRLIMIIVVGETFNDNWRLNKNLIGGGRDKLMAARMCRTPGRRGDGDHDRDHDGHKDHGDHDRDYGDEIVLESALPVHPAR